MHVHLVFVTKYRRDVFTKAILDDLRIIFANVCKESRGIRTRQQPQGRLQPPHPSEE
jgi:REP element-mobilizing transposase RayT